jgi:hypothetical protein
MKQLVNGSEWDGAAKMGTRRQPFRRLMVFLILNRLAVTLNAILVACLFHIFVLSVAVLYGTHARCDEIKADVAVVVDTSASMSQEGMDKSRTSLLVTKLLADLVPGELTVIRLLDINKDKDFLPLVPSGKTQPCPEDPSKSCNLFDLDPKVRWEDIETKAFEQKIGALSRPSRGDETFKKNLPSHLTQEAQDSIFSLAFKSGQGVFSDHEKQGKFHHKMIIWLSDGAADNDNDERSLKQIISALTRDGVIVEAVIFGKGDTRIAKEAGIDYRLTTNSGELMKAFAGIFRRVVKAPYDIDNLVAAQPDFTMKQNVEQAWIVVYGDKTLGQVELVGPDNTIVKADYAADEWKTAGAYKVAYIENPKAGQWTVKVVGGGPGAAYAVVQRSSLEPKLLEPDKALAEIPVPLVAGIVVGVQGELIADQELLKEATVTAEFQGQTLTLYDDGSHGDKTPHDGRYTGLATFKDSGKIPLRLTLKSSFVDKTVETNVLVSGFFRYTGGPISIDLGVINVKTIKESCKPLIFEAKHSGQVPFELKSLKSLPDAHALTIKLSNGSTLMPDGPPVSLTSTDKMEVCLSVLDKARSSRADDEPWLKLTVAQSQAPAHQVTIRLKWRVDGLTFWERWGWLILLILAILVLLFIILGFILPERFQPTLALVFVPERDELDEHTPQPVKQWKGVGIGFYRNARAYLHANYRLSGKAQGALACLEAVKNGVRIIPKGSSLFRENLDGDWDEVPNVGQKIRPGDIFRFSEKGPFLLVTLRR